MGKITVLIMSDQQLITDTWAFLLDNDERFAVTDTTVDAATAYAIVLTGNPQVLLCDMQLMSDDAFRVIRSLSQLSDRTKVIVVSNQAGPAFAKKILQTGAAGFITKNVSIVEFKEAILEVSEGRRYIGQEIRGRTVGNYIDEGTSPGGSNSITPREMEIILAVKTGLTSKQIAATMNITPKTVEVHRHNILKKLNLKNTAALVTYISAADL